MTDQAAMPTTLRPAHHNRRLEARAPTIPPVRDYGIGTGGATWSNETYTVAVAPGILGDGTFCIVVLRSSNPEREYLIEPQIATEAEARRLADEYRERCSIPGLLRTGDIPLLERSNETPLASYGKSEEVLADDLRTYVDEQIASIGNLTAKSLFKTPSSIAIGACIIYYMNWRISVPDWVPFARQILRSDTLSSAQLSIFLPCVLAATIFYNWIRLQGIFTTNAIAAEIVTTLACQNRWGPEKFRELYGTKILKSKLRGFFRWIVGSAGVGEIENFVKSIGRRSGTSPFEYQLETFERRIHALVFWKRDDDYSEQAVHVNAIFVAGDFQEPQFEQRLSFLDPREERELRYRARASAERTFWISHFAGYLIAAPILIAILWSIWLSLDFGLLPFTINLVVTACLVLSWRASLGRTQAPPELFKDQAFGGGIMAHYFKLTRHLPRLPATGAHTTGPTSPSSSSGSTETARPASSDKASLSS